MSASQMHSSIIRSGLSLLLFLGLYLGVSSPGSAQADGPIYIVQEGDTLSEIAYTFGVSVEAIVAANGIDDPEQIFPGQELIIPGFEGIKGVIGTIAIELGDNLRNLSLHYEVQISSLRRLNRVVHPERMYLGQPFIIVSLDSVDDAKSSLKEVAPAWSLIEYAVLQGENPWLIRSRSFQDHRMWLLAGEAIATEGEIERVYSILPFSEMTLHPDILVQGQTFEIQIQTSNRVPTEGRLGPNNLNFQQTQDQMFIALQGIHALQPAGLMDLEIVHAQEDGIDRQILFSRPLQVFEGGYGREALRVPPQTIDPDETGPEDAFIKELLSRVDPVRYWNDIFLFPASYFETFPSVYGTRRSYNGSDYDFYHTGLDLYGSTSTPIFAPARGRVVFSDFLTVRGNATYIDHGWGVFTGYLHQSQILVEDGEIVEPGQTIGFVGGTGRVTGPHLHWEIWVGGVPVNPIEWTEKVFP